MLKLAQKFQLVLYISDTCKSKQTQRLVVGFSLFDQRALKIHIKLIFNDHKRCAIFYDDKRLCNYGLLKPGHELVNRSGRRCATGASES